MKSPTPVQRLSARQRCLPCPLHDNLFSSSSSILRLVIAMFRFLYSPRFVSGSARRDGEGGCVSEVWILRGVETTMTSHMPPQGRKEEENNRGWHPAVFVSIGWIVIIKKSRASFIPHILSSHKEWENVILSITRIVARVRQIS